MTSGERWAADQLEILRAARFTPRAWIRFLAESFARAGETRRARPQLARQARTWSAIGLLGGIGACRAASRARLAAPPPARFAVWWLATSTIVDWHLGMVEGSNGERRERLSVADELTLLRLWLVPMLCAQGDPRGRSGRVFSTLVLCAGASDALDGALARRVGPTRLGRDLDTLADALTVASAARVARQAGWLPVGAARLATVKATLPVAAVTCAYFRSACRPAIEPSTTSRRLAPALLAGLAASPLYPRAAAMLTGTCAIASLALDRDARSLKTLGPKFPSNRPQIVRSRDANTNGADRQHSPSAPAHRGGS